MKLILAAMIYCLLFLLFIGVSSCNRYIDKAKRERKMPVMQGSFNFYPDSNVLIYKSNIKLKMDSYVYDPKPFYAKLPKDLKWYSVASTTFVFYYNKNQIVAILIDIYNPEIIQDTIYVPNDDEIFTITTRTNPGSNKKYQIWRPETKRRRRHLIIKKDAATILLYNILPKNYNSYVNSLKQFRFLKLAN